MLRFHRAYFLYMVSVSFEYYCFILYQWVLDLTVRFEQRMKFRNDYYHKGFVNKTTAIQSFMDSFCMKETTGFVNPCHRCVQEEATCGVSSMDLTKHYDLCKSCYQWVMLNA